MISAGIRRRRRMPPHARAGDGPRIHSNPIDAVELRRLFRAPVHLYRWRCGWLLGHRFLLLIHVGRRTGLRRRTVLEVVEYRKEGPEAVVISAFGRNADWFRNIAATPDPEVVIGSRRFTAVYRVLDEEEAVQVFAGYERRNRFVAPAHPLGAEPAPRLAIRRVAGGSPPARRTAAVHRVPPAIMMRQPKDLAMVSVAS